MQLSFLMLFVELALIRWTGSNVVLLSFFSNFILLASFLGIGVGFLRAKSTVNYFQFSPILLALLVLFCYHYRYQYHVRLDPVTGDLNYFEKFFHDNVFPVWLTLPLIFMFVTAVMTSLANGVARSFQAFPPLSAYRLEIIGSLLGIITFSALSYFNAPPLSWGVIISALFISLLMKEWRFRFLLAGLQIAALVLLVTILNKETVAPAYYWSPYYKIALEPYSQGRYVVNVNGLPQQIIESVAQRQATKPFYFFAYQHAQRHSLNKVLIVGAGTGGDVAIALAQGAKQVDAVEIDPLLYHLGNQLNPDHPYQDKRVHIHINDGRAFLQQSHTEYDMIIFALPDSLMLVAGQSSLRLENYLFTLEGIDMVKQHLAPDGVFTMYNYYRESWLVDRLANTLKTVFQQAPCVDSYGENQHWLSVLTISKSSSRLQCSRLWQSDGNPSATPTTDNYPFLYLKDNRLTSMYVTALLFVLFASFMAIKTMGVSYRAINQYLDLFFMGAAFLLLESKSIIHFALLFGTTWFVNALVFIGVLLTVYLAIEVTQYVSRLKPVVLYALLLSSLLLSWLVPDAWLLTLSLPLRFTAATALAFSPILFANLVFVQRFRLTLHAAEAFGVNILGAVLGGVLEYTSLMIGFRSLTLMVVVLYTLAILLMRMKSVNDVSYQSVG